MRIAAIVCVLGVLGACSTPRDETWIGKNVGVTVDSQAADPAGATQALDGR